MDTERICPSCQKRLAPGVPLGLCPECLIKSGFSTGVESAGAKQPPFIPPTVEELAKLFPQLEILELIGKGGMGAVYKARQPILNRFVALKILPPGIGSDPAFTERFAREAQALAQLNHPGIVTLYEFGQAGGLHFFMMEYVDGVNLRQLLINGRIASREALAIVPQICDALQFAHDQGIVHRDIKPENILLDRRGRVKVADFGLAKIIGGDNEPVHGTSATRAPSLTEAGKIIGTPQYMSPEQIAHPADVDHRADIYALGMVFYQMLTGELPGKTIEPPSKKVHIDVRLDEVVLRALESNPELRFQQVSEVKTCVDTIMATPPGDEQENAVGSIPQGRFGRKMLVGVYNGKRVTNWTGVIQTWVVIYGAMLVWLYIAFGRYVPLHDLIPSLVGVVTLVTAALVKVELKKPIEQLSPLAATETKSRFSRTAIAGATWGLLLILCFILDSIGIRTLFLGPIGLFDFVGTTTLGWIAVSQIRRSAGTLHGMWLAVFDGLLFPLLALDAAIAGLVYLIVCLVAMLPYYASGDGSFGGGIGVGYQIALMSLMWRGGAALISIIADFFIIRRVWRAVNKTDAVNSIALSAVESWLAVMDGGNYAQSWDAAAQYFQKTITKAEWIERSQSARQPQGKVISRQLRTARRFGPRFIVKFDTVFAGLKAAVETVTFSREPDGQWRAIGYLILPAYAERARLRWLGMQALFSAGLSGLLGALAFWLMPRTFPVLDWAILGSALLGIILGIPARRNRFGKGAIVVGSINFAIGLAVLIVWNAYHGTTSSSELLGHRVPSDVWFPDRINNSIGDPYGEVTVRVTDVTNRGQVVLLKLACETGRSAHDHELLVWFSGPVFDYRADIAAGVTNVDCLISPTRMTGGGKVLAGSSHLQDASAHLIGFVLPDEATAAKVVEQVRQTHLGKPRGLTDPRSALLLFLLQRRVGEDSNGKPVHESLSGELIWMLKDVPTTQTKTNLTVGPASEGVAPSVLSSP
jgi:serine/threonine protein kinase